MVKYLLLLAFAVLVVADYEPKPLRAICHIVGASQGQAVQGNITFSVLYDGKIHVEGSIVGLPPGEYGFHVHEKGDLTGGCASTGGHFNPEKKQHGHPQDEDRHVGDLGNVVFDANQAAHIDLVDGQLALTGFHNILGRAVVLHAGQDDYGRSDHPDSRKTGNAGGRVACGVIGILDPIVGWETSVSAAASPATAVSTILLSLLAILKS